jgi:hypothetical protein
LIGSGEIIHWTGRNRFLLYLWDSGDGHLADVEEIILLVGTGFKYLRDGDDGHLAGVEEIILLIGTGFKYLRDGGDGHLAGVELGHRRHQA